MVIEWKAAHFDMLTNVELYNILKLRSQVFVVEQNCVFLDADGKDEAAVHLMGFNDASLLAYARVIPAGIIYEEVSIGRVVTDFSTRGSGLGKMLMEEAIYLSNTLFGKVPIKIGAQHHLQNFYGSLGFVAIGEKYLEDDIWHIHMLLS